MLSMQDTIDETVFMFASMTNFLEIQVEFVIIGKRVADPCNRQIKTQQGAWHSARPLHLKSRYSGRCVT